MLLSPGAQSYILLLAPRLVADMERIGLARIVRESGFPEEEVTSLYFEFVTLCRALPPRPEAIPAPLWEYLIHCVQVMSALITTAEKESLDRARENAVRKFLPQARDAVRNEHEKQCQEGTIEFRLASLVRHEDSPEQSRELCREALRLEREAHFNACRQLDTEGLDPLQAAVVTRAMTYARESLVDPPEHFAAVDLVVRLLDLLKDVLDQQTSGDEPQEEGASVERIVLSLGNVLFSKELGLDPPAAADV
ncbi:hypothetical protein SAMN05216203_0143 [Marinobacter daqiaonensis]|uniref:Uncharacterized protein n=1 Tax=Marinobacter daqiaonensis TaxID=650891 RepID=A0A1I6GIN4_9GAMM|nr:hypothetical protein [Marinobacter daqiaonensis]SFR42036.1 hypothetical protein SAMN05216203_0143 [Marinobacter daqiaonensis]